MSNYFYKFELFQLNKLLMFQDLHTVNLEDFQHGKTNITGLRLVQEDTAEFQALLKEVNNRLARRKNSTALSTLKVTH